MSYKINGVYTDGDDVKVKTFSGKVESIGRQPKEPCCYGNCRMRNLCKRDHCVGRVLLENGYRVEDGTLVYEA